MITALTTILVLVSLGLVITVPVALATPGEWENSKGTLLVSRVIFVSSVAEVFSNIPRIY
jgi:photosystem II core protein PsbZ